MKFFVNKKLEKNNSIFKKKSKISLAKSTTALTCLVGVLIISSDYRLAKAVTTTGTFLVSSSVATVCTVSGSSMEFAAYTGSTITSTSTVTANCTNGTNYSIAFSTSPDVSPKYYLVRTSGSDSNAADRLEVTFANAAGATMTNAAATITGTGTGSAATAGVITGTIAAQGTAKTAGDFTKTMTLVITY